MKSKLLQKLNDQFGGCGDSPIVDMQIYDLVHKYMIEEVFVQSLVPAPTPLEQLTEDTAKNVKFYTYEVVGRTPQNRKRCTVCRGDGLIEIYETTNYAPDRTEPCYGCKGTGYIEY